MGSPLGNDYVYSRTPASDGLLHSSVVNGNGDHWRFFCDGVEEPNPGVLSGANRGLWFDDLHGLQKMALGQYAPHPDRIEPGHGHSGEFDQILIYDHPLTLSERATLQAWLNLSDGEAPAGPPQEGLHVWFDAGDPDADPETACPPSGTAVAEWKDRVSGLVLKQDDPERQPILTRTGDLSRPGIRFDNHVLSGPLDDVGFADDQQGSLVVVFTARHSGEGYGFTICGRDGFISTVVNSAAAGSEDLDAALKNAGEEVVSAAERQELDRLEEQQRLLRQQIKRLRPVAMSLRHSYGPPFEPGVPTSRVMNRGEYDNPGEVVEPGFLSCISGDEQPAPIRLDPFRRWPTRSRRMALAQWIASSDNPMTARVMVNRLWHWHFGRGIVATPSDFGMLSGGPSHPELLDWLAGQFVDSGWSIKAMHRLMVTSAAYRQTSRRVDARAAEEDPDNVLLWRFRRRRLDAEVIRDAVLSVSGRLNPEQYGLPIFPPLPDDIEQRVKYSDSKWNTQSGPEGRKRSIYIYQQRTLTMPFLQAFDALVCDESRPRRRHSVTPLQALAMYNGRLVNDEAPHFAERVRSVAGADAGVDDPVDIAVRIALGRPPEPEEAAEMRRMVESSDTGLISLCRVLLNGNEFIYVD